MACVANVDLGGPLRCAPSAAACATPDGPRCVSTADDPAHCGRCGAACREGPNARARCVSGSCALGCDPGWGDCDGSPADGCEAELERDRFHCGACGVRCAEGTGCAGGRCALVNVARRGRCAQSSTYSAGACDRAASLAVDGRLCHLPEALGGDPCPDLGCRVVSHTETEPDAWWSVDLGSVRTLARVDAWSASDGAQALERSVDGAAWTTLGPLPARTPRPSRVDAVGPARFVRVRSTGVATVRLVELEVYTTGGAP